MGPAGERVGPDDSELYIRNDVVSEGGGPQPPGNLHCDR